MDVAKKISEHFLTYQRLMNTGPVDHREFQCPSASVCVSHRACPCCQELEQTIGVERAFMRDARLDWWYFV